MYRLLDREYAAKSVDHFGRLGDSQLGTGVYTLLTVRFLSHSHNSSTLGSYVEAEENYVSVAHNVFLTLTAVESRILYGSHTAKTLEVVK